MAIIYKLYMSCYHVRIWYTFQVVNGVDILLEILTVSIFSDIEDDKKRYKKPTTKKYTRKGKLNNKYKNIKI